MSGFPMGRGGVQRLDGARACWRDPVRVLSGDLLHFQLVFQHFVAGVPVDDAVEGEAVVVLVLVLQVVLHRFQVAQGPAQLVALGRLGVFDASPRPLLSPLLLHICVLYLVVDDGQGPFVVVLVDVQAEIGVYPQRQKLRQEAVFHFARNPGHHVRFHEEVFHLQHGGRGRAALDVIDVAGRNGVLRRLRPAQGGVVEQQYVVWPETGGDPLQALDAVKDPTVSSLRLAVVDARALEFFERHQRRVFRFGLDREHVHDLRRIEEDVALRRVRNEPVEVLPVGVARPSRHLVKQPVLDVLLVGERVVYVDLQGHLRPHGVEEVAPRLERRRLVVLHQRRIADVGRREGRAVEPRLYAAYAVGIHGLVLDRVLRRCALPALLVASLLEFRALLVAPRSLLVQGLRFARAHL